MKKETESIVVEIGRTGKRPLRFTGRLAGEASTDEWTKNPRPDFTEVIEIYVTEAGKFVACSASYCVGQDKDVEAEVFDTADSLVSHFAEGEMCRRVAVCALKRAGAQHPEILHALAVDIE